MHHIHHFRALSHVCRRQSRIDRCVYACASDKAGSAGSVINLLDVKALNHQVECTRGVLENDCRELLQRFFKELRLKN